MTVVRTYIYILQSLTLELGSKFEYSNLNINCTFQKTTSSRPYVYQCTACILSSVK